MKRNVLGGASLFVAMAVLVGAAAAAEINYGDFPGVGAGEVDFLQVTEASETDPVPLFGAPTRLGNRLSFVPPQFASFAQNGDSDETTGTLTMTIQAAPDYWIQQIVITEVGDYTITGAGATANVEGTVRVVDLSPAANPDMEGAIEFVPAPPYDEPGQSVQFDGWLDFDLAEMEITRIWFELENVLETTSTSDASALIQKKAIASAPEIFVEVIPEPVTVGLLLLGAAGIIARRRRGS